MSKIINKIKEVLGPYYNTAKKILIAVAVLSVIIWSLELISSPSTAGVILGILGLGMVVTYIGVTINKKMKNLIIDSVEKKDEEERID